MEKYSTVVVDNGIGSRERRCKILVATPKGIIEFANESIPPLVRLVKSEYERNGKWSKDIFTLSVREDSEVKEIRQDFETARWISSLIWQDAIDEVKGWFPKVSADWSDEIVKGAIYSLFPSMAEKLDDEEIEWETKNTSLEELLEEQQILLREKELAVVNRAILNKENQNE